MKTPLEVLHKYFHHFKSERTRELVVKAMVEYASQKSEYNEQQVSDCTPEVNMLRYIVFLIDTKIKDHNGKIFSDYNEAREYTSNCINEQYADKAVIGMFLLNPNHKEMFISNVETIGFARDKKDVNQLQLFK